MNIRKRLVVWHAIILAGLLLIFTISLYVALSFHLYEEIDDSLASWAAHSIESLESGGPLPEGEVPMNSKPHTPKLAMIDTFVLILNDRDGSVSHQSMLSKQSLTRLQQLINSRPLNSKGSFTITTINNQPFRVFLKNISSKTGHSGETLIIGRALMHVHQTLSGLGLTLTLAWLIAVIICAVISWDFVGRTLYPVKMMTKDALEIANSEKLGRRVNEFGENDEFGQLSKALNLMLASLEKAYLTQKKFLADVSHELRNPLTSIRSNLEFITRAIKAPENERLAALNDTMVEAERMAGLINELLMLARAEAPVTFSFEKTDLTEIAIKVTSEIQKQLPLIKRQIYLNATGPALVNGDREKLRQAIMILLDNAIKYSPQGSIINFKISQQTEVIKLEITDNGPGIPEAEMELVFDRFYRASNVRTSFNGSGLGLSIVKSILDKHNGEIRLRNISPKGLEVTVTLPAAS